MQRDKPMQDLLAGAAASVAGAGPADAAAILPAAWQAACFTDPAAFCWAHAQVTRASGAHRA